MPAPPQQNALDRDTFGQRLRQARKQKGWTLAQVAERSGVSITTISRAERGQLALGYDNFAALGQALQMDMGSMFSDTQHPTPSPLQEGPVLTRAGQGVVYQGPAFAYEFLGTQAVGKKMIPTLGTVHARRITGPQDFARHPGEEFVYVLSGAIEVHFEDGRCLPLSRGDSLYFDSRLGHAYISVSRQLAKVIGVVTDESGLMRAAKEESFTGAAGGEGVQRP